MELTAPDSPIVTKTRDLCQTILDQPDFKAMRKSIDTFLADELAKTEYQNLVEQGEMLNHKQQQGAKLSQEEISGYEALRDRVVGNPVAAGFIQAQQEVHGVQEAINKYLSKTFELGRVPAMDEMAEGSCGSGCGCHH